MSRISGHVVLGLALTGCGAPSPGASAEWGEMPRLEPAGPTPPYAAEPWHRAVVGSRIENIEVRASSGREAGNCAPPGQPLKHYTETLRTGWTQSERIDGPIDVPDPAAVCIFRGGSAGPPTLEERPSARFTRFVFPDGAVVFAYGPARARLHDLVASDPRLPLPLPLAPGVVGWRMRFASTADLARRASWEWSFEWEMMGGTRYEHTRMQTEHDALVRARLWGGPSAQRGLEMFGVRGKVTP